MSAVAGRVLLLFMGDYDSATTYKPMDVVLYGVNSYVCLLESTGNVPTNTTYWQTLAKGISNVSPEALGIGYGISQNTGASKTATLADYTLTINGIVAVTFADDVPANATLNINSQGAKPIYYRGSALVANVIRGGDTVTFAYDGTHYDILCIDGGAGHEIEDASGTKLTQRDVLAIKGGLKATDDSINQKTVIDDTPDYINADDWDAMTDSEKNEYIASHNTFGILTHDSQGVINAEYMTLLWENPNTTQAFASQDVTIDVTDSEICILKCLRIGDGKITNSIVFKPSDAGLLLGDPSTAGSTNVYYLSSRSVSLTKSGNALKLSFSDCASFTQGSGGSTITNGNIVPQAIYGIKASFQFKVNAIATELSTRADHCFLDDEVTTVEDAITYKDVYSTDEHVVGKWIDGSILYEKTIDCGTLPNASRKQVAHNISNLNFVFEIRGIAYRTSDHVSIPIPRASGSGASTHTLDVYVDTTNINITPTTNYSDFNQAYVTLRYTKTS